MTTVSEQIVNLQNNTASIQATTEKTSSSTVSSTDFLQLLTEQLQYQDPLDPVDNSEMLAQEAQFATLEQLESLTSSFSEFSTVYQANSLIGQTVEVTLDNGTVTGTVEYVDLTDTTGAAISVDGTLYPVSSVTKVYPSSDDTTTDDDSETTNYALSALTYIADNIGNIYEKLSSYLTGDSSSSDTSADSSNDTSSDE